MPAQPSATACATTSSHGSPAATGQDRRTPSTTSTSTPRGAICDDGAGEARRRRPAGCCRRRAAGRACRQRRRTSDGLDELGPGRATDPAIRGPAHAQRGVLGEGRGRRHGRHPRRSRPAVRPGDERLGLAQHRRSLAPDGQRRPGRCRSSSLRETLPVTSMVAPASSSGTTTGRVKRTPYSTTAPGSPTQSVTTRPPSGHGEHAVGDHVGQADRRGDALVPVDDVEVAGGAGVADEVRAVDREGLRRAARCRPRRRPSARSRVTTASSSGPRAMSREVVVTTCSPVDGRDVAAGRDHVVARHRPDRLDRGRRRPARRRRRSAGRRRTAARRARPGSSPGRARGRGRRRRWPSGTG